MQRKPSTATSIKDSAVVALAPISDLIFDAQDLAKPSLNSAILTKGYDLIEKRKHSRMTSHIIDLHKGAEAEVWAKRIVG